MTTVKMIAYVLMICVVLSGMYVQPGCKNPDEYEPPEDSLVPPGNPPQPTDPVSGFVYMWAYEYLPFEIFIEFEWTSVEQAESYQLEYTIDTFPPIIIDCQSNLHILLIRDTTDRFCNHYWRVRAWSSAWEWYTDWSEQWYFELRMKPAGPQLLYPPNDTIFYVDSFPTVIEVQWNTVQDEEFYEMMIFQDSVLQDQFYVYENFYEIYVEDTMQYSWRVNAHSSYWQYPSYWSNLWSFRVRLENR
jgi:hypothetical protein